MNIINIEHLTHSFTERLLFDDVSFYLSDKDKVGVIGINGTGKSTLLKIIAGKETADRADIIMQRDLRIAYLPQIPEFADTHTTLSGALPLTEEISDQPENYIPQAKSMLHQLGFTRYDQPITELSGGQRKRIALVRTLLTPADVLILDEPTNHLDSAMAEWLEKTLRAESRPLIMITHDLGIVAQTCDNVAVMYAGEIIEIGTAEDIFNGKNHHPYTEGLFGSIPRLNTRVKRLTPIDGLMPDPTVCEPGCKFAPRCSKCMDICREKSPEVHYEGTHAIRCHLFQQTGQIGE